MRLLFALPGLHRVPRGAEVAFISVARALAEAGDTVTLIGSGVERPGTPYRFIHAGCCPREYFERAPALPSLRNDCGYEELSFLPGLLRRYNPTDYDVTLTCGYPWVNWMLRARTRNGKRPPHVFVTQNGDWPAIAENSEYRFFSCEGLVCTNPDFFERNSERWQCALIPNGIDADRFRSAAPDRGALGLPSSGPIVLMVSALIPSKRVDLGIQAVSNIPGCHLVVAGDGPERSHIDGLGARLLPGRFKRLTVSPDRIPTLYKSADAFLHLSKEESFGNVFLEAMAAGLPVVAPDTERIRWIVGDGEFLASGDQPEGIAASLSSALAAKSSGKAQTSSRVDEFDWAIIAGKYKKFLETIVHAHP